MRGIRYYQQLQLYQQFQPMMTAQFDLGVRIRTQESQEYSICSGEYPHLQHSIDSISLADEAVTLHIQNLRKLEQDAGAREKQSSRSHSYIHISDEDSDGRRKTNSMKNNPKNHISVQHVPHAAMSQLLSYHRCLNLAKNDLHNRAYGAMFGFLIGDSIGSTIVNRPYCEEDVLNALMMRGGGVMNLKPGQGTDEWEVCLSLCEGLIEGGGAYDSNKIAAKYLEWIDSNPFDLPVLLGISFSDIKKRRREKGGLDYSTLADQLRHSSLRNLKHESVLGLTRIIPLTIWGLNLEEYEFNQIIKEEMKFITPNEFVVESSLVFANLLKCIMTTGDHLLAFHKASQYIHTFGSEKMMELWSCIEDNQTLTMATATANNLKYPFVYAVNEMLEIDPQHKDLKKSFIESTIRTLSKGFNTDTNCSIVLGLVGAVVGYNNIPSYFRSRVLTGEYSASGRVRTRDYSSKRVIEAVGQLLREGPTHLGSEFF